VAVGPLVSCPQVQHAAYHTNAIIYHCFPAISGSSVFRSKVSCRDHWPRDTRAQQSAGIDIRGRRENPKACPLCFVVLMGIKGMVMIQGLFHQI